MSPEYKVSICSDMLTAADEGAKEFRCEANEIFDYAHESDTKKDYQHWDVDKQFRCNVLMPAQYVDIFGAHLYQDNPTFKVQRTEWSNPQSAARAEAAEQWLNYIPRENDMEDELRPSVRDSLLAGMGCIWHGLTRKPGVTANVYGAWDETLLDPNARMMNDCAYIIRKRFKPKWWLQKRYPRKAATIQKLEGRSRPTDVIGGDDSNTGTGIVFYEFYLKHGIHNFANSALSIQAISGKQPDDAIKFVIADGGGGPHHLLYEGPWETPYWRDGTWPCSILSYINRRNSPYPVSPLKAALPWIKALNWAVTITLIQDRWSAKRLIASVKSGGFGLSEEAVRKALRFDGQAVSVIEAAFEDIDEGAADVRKYLQDVSFSSDMDERMRTISFLKQQVEDHSGLTAFLTSGQPETQDRSAEASRNRRDMAFTRIGDMRSRMEKWLSDIGRKHYITAVAHYDPQEDIAPLIGPQHASAFPMLVDEGEREQAMMMAQQNPMDEMLMQKAMALSEGVTIDEVLRETQFTVESGSTQRVTPEQEISSLTEFTNQTGPAMLQSPDPMERALAFDAYAEYYKAAKLNPALVEKFQAHAEQLRQQAMLMQQQQQQAAMMPPQMPQEGAPI